MNIIIQIPSYNEEDVLADTIADIPRSIPGIDRVEIMVIDDGSTDNTVAVAKAAGADHIVCHKRNKGLARAFETGLEQSLHLGADIIVNTDADNQYKGSDIPRLLEPILAGQADITIGDRQTDKIGHFSPIKKFLQKLGSSVVRRLSGINVTDAVSGFRAYNKEAAIACVVMSGFSYTVETIIQAGMNKLAITSIPIQVNEDKRPSRLARSTLNFVLSQAATIIRIYAMYKPMKVFFTIASLMTLIGFVPVVRFLINYFSHGEAGFIQSLILGSALIIIGLAFFILGLIGDLIARNRQFSERILVNLRRQKFGAPKPDLSTRPGQGKIT